MFKKTGHIIISGLLVIVIAGITVNMHYCGDQLYSFKINGQPSECCDNDHCGHCKDESVKIMIHDDYLPVLDDNQLSEIVPVHILGRLNNNFVVERGFENSFYRIYASDLSPPGIEQKLSFLQAYLL